MNNRKLQDLKFGEECEKLFLSKFKNVKKKVMIKWMRLISNIKQKK